MSLVDKNDKTVFILGAGASYGDTLVNYEVEEGEITCGVPLTNQFFQTEYLEGEIDEIKRDYPDLLDYIKTNWRMDEFGSERWSSLNLEAVFTSLAIENEFAPSDTDEKAKTQLRLNSLKRYIRKVIAKNGSGSFSMLNNHIDSESQF